MKSTRLYPYQRIKIADFTYLPFIEGISKSLRYLLKYCLVLSIKRELLPEIKNKIIY